MTKRIARTNSSVPAARLTWRTQFIERLRRARGPVVAVAAIGTVLSGFVGYWNTWRTVREGVTAPTTTASASTVAGVPVVPYSAADHRMTFAVLPFDAPTGDAAAERLAQSTYEATQAHEESRYLWARTTPQALVTRTLPQYPAPDALAQELGVHYFLRGTVSRQGEGHEVDLTLADAHTGRVLDRQTFRPEPGAEVAARAVDLALSRLTYSALKDEVVRAEAKPEADLDVRDLTFRAYGLSDDAAPPAEVYARRKRDLDRALALSPDDLTALTANARIHLCECLRAWARDLDEMERIGMASVDRFLTLRPGSLGMLDLRGYVFFKHRRYEDVLLIADEVLRKDPDDAEALWQFVMAHLRLGQTTQAQAAVPRLLLAAVDPQGEAVAAAAHFAAGDDPSAAAAARKALIQLSETQRKNPQFGAASLVLVAAEERAGQPQRAAAALRDFQAAVPQVRTLALARSWLLPNSPVPEDDAFFAALRKAGLGD